MQTHRHDSWREALKFMNRCPICSNQYQVEDAQLFAENGNAKMAHLTCRTCRSFFIAMIMVAGHGVSSVGMVTDLSFSDAKRLYNTDSISIDEVILSHQLLQKNTLFN